MSLLLSRCTTLHLCELRASEFTDQVVCGCECGFLKHRGTEEHREVGNGVHREGRWLRLWEAACATLPESERRAMAGPGIET